MTLAFIFDSVCGTEWLVLLGVILIVVGPKNLPATARKFGEIMAKLRRAADEFKRQIMAMDEEVRRTVDDAVKTDYVETPKEESAASTSEDSSSDAGEDRGEMESDYYGSENYDENNPYPGHEFYDETTYENGDCSIAESDAKSEPESKPEPEVVAEASAPVKPKVDPYAVKITVSTNSGKKGAKA